LLPPVKCSISHYTPTFSPLSLSFSLRLQRVNKERFNYNEERGVQIVLETRSSVQPTVKMYCVLYHVVRLYIGKVSCTNWIKLV
jgi:hypothetical protein